MIDQAAALDTVDLVAGRPMGEPAIGGADPALGVGQNDHEAGVAGAPSRFAGEQTPCLDRQIRPANRSETPEQQIVVPGRACLAADGDAECAVRGLRRETCVLERNGPQTPRIRRQPDDGLSRSRWD